MDIEKLINDFITNQQECLVSEYRLNHPTSTLDMADNDVLLMNPVTSDDIKSFLVYKINSLKREISDWYLEIKDIEESLLDPLIFSNEIPELRNEIFSIRRKIENNRNMVLKLEEELNKRGFNEIKGSR